MKIILLSDERIRLEPTPGPMSIEADSADRRYSPFHMVAGGLATCVFSVLASWADTAKIPVDDLAVEVGWSFAEEPHRVGAFDMRLEWPGLPENRRAAAQRVVTLCPLHATFHHPPTIEVEVST